MSVQIAKQDFTNIKMQSFSAILPSLMLGKFSHYTVFYNTNDYFQYYNSHDQHKPTCNYIKRISTMDVMVDTK